MILLVELHSPEIYIVRRSDQDDEDDKDRDGDNK